ncbi:MAG: response regulator [Cellvibrionaceae bacterium]|nr:response regulator [Cellvibrionaceae bacterium]
MATNAYIVDDDKGFRESLVWLLNGVDVPSQEFASAEEFLEDYDGGTGCLLLDIRMGGISGLDLQAKLQQKELALPVIILTGHGDVPLAVKAMQNGALDFIEKPFNGEELIKKIKRAMKLARQEEKLLKRKSQYNALWHSLSGRERDVYKLIVQGKSNKEMAEDLGISVRTLEIHRLRVLKKMEVKNAVELSQLNEQLQTASLI